MSNASHRQGRSYRRTLSEFSASYLIPVSILLLTGVSLITLQWRAAFSGYNVGEPSPRTYYAISTIRFLDGDATERLRDIAANSVAGVTVRDTGALDRMEDRLDDFRDLLAPRPGERPESALPPKFPPGMIAAFQELEEPRRAALLLLARQIGDAWFEA
jgi:hypothetical protein